MKRILLATALLFTQPAFAADDKPVWQYNNTDGEASLVYSIPESDGVVMIMSCKPARGAASITVVETSDKVKPNAKVKVVLTAGKTVVTLDGKTEPNEDAGVPTAVASTTTKSPIFAALGTADKLNVAVAGFKMDDVPLGGISPHLSKFIAACGKK